MEVDIDKLKHKWTNWTKILALMLINQLYGIPFKGTEKFLGTALTK